MASTVEGYLAELRQLLAGADPALVQDAVYDADEYLRSALLDTDGDPQAAFAAAVEAYGTPEEVASAYRDAELTVTAALRTPRPRAAEGNPFMRFFGVVADPRAWGALFYLLLTLATGIIYFTVVVTGISLTAGTLVLIVGLPIALLVLAIVRAVSFAEGRLVEGLLGVRMPRRPRTVGVQGNILQRIKGWLTDWHTWTSMLYMVLQLPLGIIYFTLMVTSISISASFIALPIVQSIFNQPFIINGEYGYMIEWWAFPLFVAAGLLGFVLTLWLARALGYVQGIYAKAMLVGRIDSAASAPQFGAPVSSYATAAPQAAPPAPSAPAPASSGGSQGGDVS